MAKILDLPLMSDTSQEPQLSPLKAKLLNVLNFNSKTGIISEKKNNYF